MGNSIGPHLAYSDTVSREIGFLYQSFLIFVIAGFDPWVGRIPWRREQPPTHSSVLGEFHGQRNLVVYNPWGHKESNTTE